MGMKRWTMPLILSSNFFFQYLRQICWQVDNNHKIQLLFSLFKDYPKLSQTYYVLLECLAQDHMAFLATLEPQVSRIETQWITIFIAMQFVPGLFVYSRVHIRRVTSPRWES